MVKKEYKKKCENCGVEFFKRENEAPGRFLKRRFCSKFCIRGITLPDKICLTCGKKFNRKRLCGGRLEAVDDYRDRKYCSKECYFVSHRGKKHHNWKGGVKHRSDGYLRFTDDRYVHRVVMENYLGRKLKPEEVVHHRDGDVTNNDIENLQLLTNSFHRQGHVKTQSRNKKGRFIK